MRILKPLLAGATLLALGVPALASAEPYFDHGGDYGYSRDGGYARGDYGRGYRDDGRWEQRRFQDGWRYRDYHRHHRHFWDRWDRGGWR
jgi:hypothetical protein